MVNVSLNETMISKKRQYELSEVWPKYDLVAKIRFTGVRTARLLLCNSDGYTLVDEKRFQEDHVCMHHEFNRLRNSSINYKLIHQQQLINGMFLYLTKYAVYEVYDDQSFKSWLISNLV